MGYRIDYAVGRSTMLVRVSGRTRTQALAIAREIRREAKRASIQHLVIDVRGLADRFGSLGTLVLAACLQPGRRDYRFYRDRARAKAAGA
jgi:hypothetical protein